MGFGLDLPHGVNLSGLIGSVLPGVTDHWLEESSAADKMTVQLEPPELPLQLDAAVQDNHQIEQGQTVVHLVLQVAVDQLRELDV